MARAMIRLLSAVFSARIGSAASPAAFHHDASVPVPLPPTRMAQETAAARNRSAARIIISAAEQFCCSILDTKNTLQHLLSKARAQSALADEERRLEDALYKAAFGPLFAEAVAQGGDLRRPGVGGRAKEKTGSQSILLTVEALEYFTKKQALPYDKTEPLHQKRLADACANALQEAHHLTIKRNGYEHARRDRTGTPGIDSTADRERLLLEPYYRDTAVDYMFLYPQTSHLHQQGEAGGAEEELWYELRVKVSLSPDEAVASVAAITHHGKTPREFWRSLKWLWTKENWYAVGNRLQQRHRTNRLRPAKPEDFASDLPRRDGWLVRFSPREIVDFPVDDVRPRGEFLQPARSTSKGIFGYSDTRKAFVRREWWGDRSEEWWEALIGKDERRPPLNSIRQTLQQQSPAKTSADRMIVLDQQVVAGHPAVRAALETYFFTLRTEAGSVLERCDVRADAFGSAVSGFATGKSDIDYSFTPDPELPENSDSSDTTTRCILHTTGDGTLPDEFDKPDAGGPAPTMGDLRQGEAQWGRVDRDNFRARLENTQSWWVEEVSAPHTDQDLSRYPVPYHYVGLPASLCAGRREGVDGRLPFDAFPCKFWLLENLAREMIQGPREGVILRQARTGEVWMKWSSLKIEHDAERHFVLGQGTILVRQDLLDLATGEQWLSFKIDLTVNNFAPVQRQKLGDTQRLASSHPTVRNVGRMFFSGAKERDLVGTSHKNAYEVMPTFRHLLAFMQFLVQGGYYCWISGRMERVSHKPVPAEETLLLEFLKYFRGILQAPTPSTIGLGHADPLPFPSPPREDLVQLVRNVSLPSGFFRTKNPWNEVDHPGMITSSLSLWTRDPWLQLGGAESRSVRTGGLYKFIDPEPRLLPELTKWIEQLGSWSEGLMDVDTGMGMDMNGGNGGAQPTGSGSSSSSSSTEQLNRCSPLTALPSTCSPPTAQAPMFPMMQMHVDVMGAAPPPGRVAGDGQAQPQWEWMAADAPPQTAQEPVCAFPGWFPVLFQRCAFQDFHQVPVGLPPSAVYAAPVEAGFLSPFPEAMTERRRIAAATRRQRILNGGKKSGRLGRHSLDLR